MPATACPGCGVLLDAQDGPGHAYIESSPACWALYGTVLAREYENPAAMGVHRLTVDTYAVQHPGQPSRRAIQSVAVHLVALHLLFERGFPPPRVTAALQRLVESGTFTWLPPPGSRGELTVAYVAEAGSLDEHVRRVQAWARSAWDAWAEHHPQVRAWAGALVG